MTTPLIVLLVLCILPLSCGWISGYFRHKQLGEVDNKHPRGQNAQLTGAGARACSAQNNSWEALALYTAALFALYSTQVPVADYALWCWVYLGLRVAYTGLYLANLDILRSVVWLGSYAILMYFFAMAL
ncbi:Uncharacterised protein [BD1-7 clade bacterium]|nr:Uncharacterised protein [BD1-7 clade bacterium]